MALWKRQPPTDRVLPAIDRWFHGELGGAVRAAEQQLLAPQLKDCFGYHLLQLSVDRDAVFYSESRVQHKHRAGPFTGMPAPFTRCDWHQLPFATDSVDVVILHHVLEFSSNPHALLREIQRVQVANGRLFVLGFNPCSLFALRSRLSRWRGGPVWQNHWLMPGRVTDWLQLLGFDVEQVRYGYHRPPLTRPRRLLRPAADSAFNRWAQACPGGAFYLLSAVKQVAAVTPLKLRWTPTQALGKLVVVKPTATNVSGSREHPRPPRENCA